MSVRVLLCWSGGKDSARALHELRARSDVQVAGLLTTVTKPYERISMHGVRRELLERQAAAVGCALDVVEIPAPCPNEVYETGMRAALERWRARGVDTVAFGDIFLEDLRRWREERLREAGFRALFPIWKRGTRALMREFLALGFRAVTTCVDPKVLDPAFCGRELDLGFLADLPAGVDPCGENGEYHSFVYDGPIFRERVRFALGERVQRDGFAFCDLVPQREEHAACGLGVDSAARRQPASGETDAGSS